MPVQPNAHKVLIAGGGTGGHIYPALSIAKAILEKYPNAQVEFVGTKKGLESQLIPRENFKLHYVPVGKLNVGFLEKLKTLFLLPWAFVSALFLILRFRPKYVIGVGGYASGPVVFVAALCGIQSFIWEPNAYPGMANRWLSAFVKRCFVVFSSARTFLKNENVTPISMPVRKELDFGVMNVPATSFFRILVFGGSQGARAINNCLLQAVSDPLLNPQWRSDVQIVHQVGPADFKNIESEYKKMPGYGTQLQCFEYLHDMPARYGWADLVICRAGTGTLSELASCGKAAILIPLPTAADDHQTKNALEYVKQGAARLLPQSELTADRLIKEIVDLKSQPALRIAMSEKVKKFHSAGAALKLVDLIIE
jgi:UDP-N-acetylglucosamine--N-acetylmuramyl-(pentapeptide) pyrophosphoryl-undecaprenol N-acetylglucosamine transferase